MSRFDFSNIDGKTMNHRSGVHFGIAGNLARFVYGALEIQLIKKTEADALYSFFLGCVKKDLPFTMASDSGYNFGIGSGITITGCRLQNFRSIEGMITPRPGRMHYDLRLDYISGQQTGLVSGTGVVSVGSGVEPETTYTDPRDGTIYNLVTINGLVWMAESLRYVNQGSSVNNNVANDAEYGRLYSQNEVFSSLSAFTDFRIPTQSDWQNLIDYVGSGNISKIKSITTWDIAGTNDTGFDAKGAGLLSGGVQSFLGRNAFFWSSEIGAGGRTYMAITTLPSVEAVIDTAGIGASYLFSVRYVKDV